MIAETPSWKNEADRFIQFQENVNINFTIEEEWRYWAEKMVKISRFFSSLLFKDTPSSTSDNLLSSEASIHILTDKRNATDFLLQRF